MSGLAKIMLAMGKRVTGSDMEENEEVIKLRELGIDVQIGHDASNLPLDVEQVIVTAALLNDNPEVLAARAKNIPIWRRSQLIGYLMRDKVGVAVAGMHGKTTVSAMISTILEENSDDPTVLVGANVKFLGTNAKLGQSDLVVAEACEYQKSFLDFEPQIAVITNIEEEHLDTYHDLRGIIEAFTMFAAKVPIDGLLVGCLDDKNVLKVLKDRRANKIGYGFAPQPKNFTGVYWQILRPKKNMGKEGYRVKIDGELMDYKLQLSLPGEVNILNAVAALIVADFLTVPLVDSLISLANFTGASRRFDIWGEKNGVVVVDDYGHHPTEIINTLNMVKQQYPKRDLWVVFWPHQYERTRDFFDQFVTCFEGVKKVVVIDIYAARATTVDKDKINSEKMVAAMKKRNIDAMYLATWPEALSYVRDNIQAGNVLLTLGAGPIDQLARKYMQS